MPAVTPGSIPLPGPGERAPMPAGPGSARHDSGEKSAHRLGLVAAVILTAGLASAVVFRGDFRQAQQAALPPQTAVEVSVAGPTAKAPPRLPEPAAVPDFQPPSELPSFGTPGSLPSETARPAPNSHPSPLPFFSSHEEDAVPKVTDLQPYGTAPESSPQAGAASPVLPASNRLIPRLQPYRGGGLPGISRGPAAAAATAAAVPCTSCKNAVPGSRTDGTLQGGKSYVQHEITMSYAGVCDGKHAYDYKNVTSNMTIGMKVRTTAGESWTFTLGPGQTMSIKSSAQFTPGTYESIRVSEVMN